MKAGWTSGWARPTARLARSAEDERPPLREAQGRAALRNVSVRDATFYSLLRAKRGGGLRRGLLTRVVKCTPSQPPPACCAGKGRGSSACCCGSSVQLVAELPRRATQRSTPSLARSAGGGLGRGRFGHRRVPFTCQRMSAKTPKLRRFLSAKTASGQGSHATVSPLMHCKNRTFFRLGLGDSRSQGLCVLDERVP